MEYRDCEFTDQEVELDNNEFVNCNFKQCVFIFRGGPVSFVGCNFESPRFVFRDVAQATLGFLAALYRDGGKFIVEEIFQAIRQSSAGPAWDNPSRN